MSAIKAESKRQNFNVTPEQEAQITWLREALDAPSMKDVVVRAVQLLALIVREGRSGNDLCLRSPGGEITRVLLPELPVSSGWTYLTERPHSWRKQLYVKGRKLLASTVWSDALVNGMTPDEAADNWDLPVEAIYEVIRYCEQSRDLIKMEAAEERTRLAPDGVFVAA